MTAKWDITSNCNLDCLHCCVGSLNYNKKGVKAELSTSEIFIILNKLKEAGFTQIQLTGGEPTITENFLEILSTMKKLDFEVILNTNGTTLNEEMIDELIKIEVDSVIFSLDGPDSATHDYIRGKGVFDKVIGNVEQFLSKRNSKSRQPEIKLNTVIMKPVLSNAAALVELAKKLKVDWLIVNDLILSESGIDNQDLISVDSFIKKLEFINAAVAKSKDIKQKFFFETYALGYGYINYKHQTRYKTEFLCSAGKNGFYIQADGDVYPCMRSKDMNQHIDELKEKPVSTGGLNLLKHSFENILRSDFFRTFYSYYERSHKEKEPCNQCKFFSYCKPCVFDHCNTDNVQQCKAIMSSLRETLEVK